MGAGQIRMQNELGWSVGIGLKQRENRLYCKIWCNWIIEPCSLRFSNKKGQSCSFLASPIVHVIPCILSNDDNVIQPSIEFDARLKVCVGLNLDVDIDFVKKQWSHTEVFERTYRHRGPYIFSHNPWERSKYALCNGVPAEEWKNWPSNECVTAFNFQDRPWDLRTLRRKSSLQGTYSQLHIHNHAPKPLQWLLDEHVLVRGWWRTRSYQPLAVLMSLQ